jgi:hypothetical protein
MPRAVETGVTTAVLFLAVCLLLVSPMLAEISVALELVAGRLYGVTVLCVPPSLFSSQSLIVRAGTTCARSTQHTPVRADRTVVSYLRAHSGAARAHARWAMCRPGTA